MPLISTGYSEIKKYCNAHNVTLVAISKTKTVEEILKIYNQGQKIFGENKVQELITKHETLDKSIEWHLVGHLQSNKVKSVVPFVSLIHSVDSRKLLAEINDQSKKINRLVHVLLQVHIAQEETKFGFSFNKAQEILLADELQNLNHVRIKGLMGMASLTENENQVRNEFHALKIFFEKMKTETSGTKTSLIDLQILSMGMSGDYKIAIEEGSTMVRIGSAIFGNR